MDIRERVARILACSAIDAELSGLLFFDLDPALTYLLADWLAAILAGSVPVIPIASGAAEENLWDRITLDRRHREQPEDLGLRWAPGPLAGYARPAGIVVVPDLARAGLPVTRAAVALVGAEVAYLQRSGVSRTWHPRDRWLTALCRQDAGRVSAHLLDRFSVRVDAGKLCLPRYGGPVLPDLPDAWTRAIRAVLDGAELPAFAAGAANRVVTTVPASVPGVRRDLALGRVARALAALAGQQEVLPEHVDDAAVLVGLRPAGPDGAEPGLGGSAGVVSRLVRSASPLVPAETQPNASPSGEWAAQGPVREGGISARVPVARGKPVQLTPVEGGEEFAFSDGPYPEDIAKPGPDLAPLRLGWQRAVTGPPRGAPIGTQRAVNTRDIAIAATLLNAARFQRHRCHAHHRQRHQLHLRPPDLRSYRRAPRPAALLVLVLDHSCRVRNWDWYGPLAAYLRWAYVNRALVGVVELGTAAGDAVHELRATQFRSRGVLDPRVAAALGRRPTARATPLAHALTLAADLLRHDTQQAGAPVSEAFLVVVTDGRANVPLAASLSAQMPPAPVRGAAVSDARTVAEKIGALRRVRSVVIDSGSRPNAHLTVTLASALRGRLVHARPTRMPPAGVPAPESAGGV